MNLYFAVAIASLAGVTLGAAAVTGLMAQATPKAKEMPEIHCTRMPINGATPRFCATPRMARPISLYRMKRYIAVTARTAMPKDTT